MQNAVRTLVGDATRPLQRRLDHGVERVEVTASPEALAHIRYGSLDLGLVLRPACAVGIDEHAVVLRELRIGTVQLRDVDVRLDHAGLEVVETNLLRRPTEEGERRHVTAHTHASWSQRNTGYTNSRRLWFNVMVKPCTVCRVPLRGSVHMPKRP